MAEKDEKVQAMTLLHVVGADAIEVYKTFTWGNKKKWRTSVKSYKPTVTRERTLHTRDTCSTPGYRMKV